MYKIAISTIFLFLTVFSCAYANVFEHQTTAEKLANSLPEINSVSCKFTQEKKFPKSTLKSGGNFHFVKERGVIFETLYPVKTTTSYTSANNSQINNIIKGIANKDYSFINKNFELYYEKEANNWIVALKPKAKSPAAQQLKNIIIYGNRNINQIDINTLNGNYTKIKFDCD